MERLAFTGALPAVRGSSLRSRPSHADTADPPAAADVRFEREDVLAYRGLLAFTFVLFIRPQDSIPILDILHLGDLTAAFAFIALAAGRMGRGVPLIRMSPELAWVLTLGAVMVVTAPLSLWPGGALAVFTDVFSKVLLIFALMVNTVTTRARLEWVVRIVVLGMSYIAVRAVIDYARGVNLVEGGRVTGAVGGLFGNPNDMALNMVAFLPLAIIAALERREWIFRAIAILGVPAIAAAIIFSKSRGGTIGLVGMLLVLVYQIRRVRPVVAAMVVAACLVTIPMLPPSFTQRMSSIFNPEEDPTGSREARKRLMREGYQAFLANPFFGIGAGQFVNYAPEKREEAWRETHNAFLQAAAELGIAGIVVFSVVVGIGFSATLRTRAALRRAHRGRRARAPDRARHQHCELVAAAFVASMTGWLLAAMFSSVAYYWTLYIVLGLAVAHRDIVTRELQSAGRLNPTRRTARVA